MGRRNQRSAVGVHQGFGQGDVFRFDANPLLDAVGSSFGRRPHQLVGVGENRNLHRHVDLAATGARTIYRYYGADGGVGCVARRQQWGVVAVIDGFPLGCPARCHFGSGAPVGYGACGIVGVVRQHQRHENRAVGSGFGRFADYGVE